jgi:uncharacterized protein YdaT
MSDKNCCGACGYPIHATKDKACDWCRQTADRIEALIAERDDYAFKLADANNTYSEMHVALSEANDKLATCEKYRDAYAECDKIGTQAVRELEAKLAKAVEALRDLIQHAHNCEKELTEELHHQDFCGESLPLTNARATLAEIEGEK